MSCSRTTCRAGSIPTAATGPRIPSRPSRVIRSAWIDEDDNGRYDVLEVETRHMKGPRTFEGTGLPLHKDNQTVVKERIYLNKANPDRLHDEITTIDNALTRPWTVTKNFRRERNPRWFDNDCSEDNHHVSIG